MAEAEQVDFPRGLALAEEDLTAADADKRDARAEKFHDGLVVIVGNSAEQIGTLEREIEGAAAVQRLEAMPQAGQAHEAIEHVAAKLPNFAGFNRGDVGRAGQAAEAGHFAHDEIGRSLLKAQARFFGSGEKSRETFLGRGWRRKDGDLELAALDNERGVAGIAVATKRLALLHIAAHDETLLPEQELWRDAGEKRIVDKLRGGHDLRILADRQLHLRDGLEGDGAGRARDHAFAAANAARVAHAIVQIEANAGARALARAADDLVFLHVVARADAAFADDAGSVVDQKNG